ncbi:MAG: hypothetical protein JSU72_16985 [Deltaproteobacteria bacterium]|nr:MAG: hypothetical protein JSU72_16985 [Deltaproteobacteria bacterium]
MTNVSDLENDLLARLIEENSGRRITRIAGSRWGRLFLPAPDEAARRPDRGLRVLCVGSWTLGFLAFEALLSIEILRPGGINLVGLVTDDPLDADAKISVKKRFWRYYEEPEREEYEWGILHRALSLGIPCYTGEVKSGAFREILTKWDPEAIVVAAFGQVIDEVIIEFPCHGIYNVHPSDLLHCHGAGPEPWEDLVERKASSTRVTLHRVSPTIDDGDIVGRSPEINVRLPDRSVSNDVRMIGEKTLLPVGPMVRELALALMDKRARGLKGPLDSLDFERSFGPDFKSRLMEPLDPTNRGHILPLPEDEEQYTV